MKAISYSHARQNLAKTMDRVCDEHDLVIITRKSSKPVVMLSLDTFNVMQETAYLLANPNNANRLRESIRQYEDGNYKKKDLLE